MPPWKVFNAILEPYLDVDTVYLDIETTGLDEENDRVLEITIVSGDGSTLVNTLVNPEMPISRQLQSIHGITQGMVEKAPVFAEVEGPIIDALTGKLTVIYGKDFDLQFSLTT